MLILIRILEIFLGINLSYYHCGIQNISIRIH